MDEGELLAVRLPCGQRREAAVDLRETDSLGREGFDELVADADDPIRTGQLGGEILHLRYQGTNGMDVLDPQDVHGDAWCHIRIPIPVASDPGSETKRCACGIWFDTEASELMVEFVVDVRYGPCDERIEEVDHRSCLVDRGRTFDSQLIGLPHGVDQLRHPSLHTLSLGRGC